MSPPYTKFYKEKCRNVTNGTNGTKRIVCVVNGNTTTTNETTTKTVNGTTVTTHKSTKTTTPEVKAPTVLGHRLNPTADAIAHLSSPHLTKADLSSPVKSGVSSAVETFGEIGSFQAKYQITTRVAPITVYLQICAEGPKLPSFVSHLLKNKELEQEFGYVLVNSTTIAAPELEIDSAEAFSAKAATKYGHGKGHFVLEKCKKWLLYKKWFNPRGKELGTKESWDKKKLHTAKYYNNKSNITGALVNGSESPGAQKNSSAKNSSGSAMELVGDQQRLAGNDTRDREREWTRNASGNASGSENTTNTTTSTAYLNPGNTQPLVIRIPLLPFPYFVFLQHDTRNENKYLSGLFGNKKALHAIHWGRIVGFQLGGRK